jgi:hypothetical protein
MKKYSFYLSLFISFLLPHISALGAGLSCKEKNITRILSFLSYFSLFVPMSSYTNINLTLLSMRWKIEGKDSEEGKR